MVNNKTQDPQCQHRTLSQRALDDIKRETMIELLEALVAALDDRIGKLKALALSFSRGQFQLSRREAKKAKQGLDDCKLRVDEVSKLKKIVMGTIETCKDPAEPYKSMGGKDG